MLKNTFVLVNNLQHKLKITQHLRKQSQFQLQFPRNVQELLRLEQEYHPALIIVFLPHSRDSAVRACRYLKHNDQTKNIPILLIDPTLLTHEPQVADACLSLDVGERALEQTMRQLTMGY